VIPLGLSTAERAQFERALRSTHEVRVTIRVQTLAGDTLAAITPVVLEGEVQVDITGESDGGVTRTASVTFLDPNHAMSFDTDSPDDGALYADRMLRIYYGIYVESLADWVDVSVFRGPLTRLERAGGNVTVEGQGKEALARNAVWLPLTLKKGTRLSDAIRIVLRDRAGESLFDIPKLGPKLPKAQTLNRFSTCWSVAAGFAKSLDRQLFYDGRGVLRLRALPKKPVYVFNDGDGGEILTPPTVTYALETFQNVVLVTGGKPKGSKKAVTGEASPNPNHPLSPKKQGRNGVWRRYPKRISAPKVTSKKRANSIAKDHLEDLLLQTVEVSFDSMVIPHLDPGDIARVRTDDFSANFRLKQFAIPLAGGQMTVGYRRRVSIRKGRIR
jgi:hypothetical protein